MIHETNRKNELKSQHSTWPYMFLVLHPFKKGNLWVIHGSFMTPVVWSFIPRESSTCLAFPFCQATVVLRYGQLPVGGSPSGSQEIFKIWISTPPNKLKLETKILRKIASFWNNLCKNMSLLKHPHSIVHLFGFYGGIFQFNDPTVSPPARLLPTRYLPPSPATGNPSHPAKPGDLSYGLRLRCP